MRTYTFTNQEQVEILQSLWARERDNQGNLPTPGSVAREFNVKYGRNVRARDIERLVARFRANGICSAEHQKQPTPVDETTMERVRQFFENDDNKLKSLRQAGRELNYHHTTVYRALKKMKWHPFKLRAVHKLSPDDPRRRSDMALTLLPIFMSMHILSNVVWSDECIFKTNGKLNRQNTRLVLIFSFKFKITNMIFDSSYWAPRSSNPNWIGQHNTSSVETVHVWAGIFRNHIIGPFTFNEGRNNTENYCEMLENRAFPA